MNAGLPDDDDDDDVDDVDVDNDDDVWFKVAGMSMIISDCPLNSVNSCLFWCSL